MTAKLEGEHKHVSVYFPRPMLEEIQAECRRLDRPFPWMLRRVWELARTEIAALPALSSGARGG